MALLRTFALRERVRLTAPLEVVPAGALGTVVRTYLAPQYIEIWFDGAVGPCVVRVAALERVEETSAAPATQ